jgi:Pyruvate/2-oxoacid:ferredoxin oxidoreductase gamma subunit
MHEVRAVNIVLVGAASHFLPLPEAAYEEAMKARLPEKIVAVNVQAFRAGRALLRGLSGDSREQDAVIHPGAHDAGGSPERRP